MRNYTYHSRIIAELYCEDRLSKCEVLTLHYDGSTESHKMWMTKIQFEAAMDGDQHMQRSIEAAYEHLVREGRI